MREEARLLLHFGEPTDASHFGFGLGFGSVCFFNGKHPLRDKMKIRGSSGSWNRLRWLTIKAVTKLSSMGILSARNKQATDPKYPLK